MLVIMNQLMILLFKKCRSLLKRMQAVAVATVNATRNAT